MYEVILALEGICDDKCMLSVHVLPLSPNFTSHVQQAYRYVIIIIKVHPDTLNQSPATSMTS